MTPSRRVRWFAGVILIVAVIGLVANSLFSGGSLGIL